MKGNLVIFFEKNKSAIIFWLVLVLLFPIIIFFIKFDATQLSTINDFGLFGSYLSGFASVLTVVMTSVSVFVLYYTLRITMRYNEKNIESIHSQNKVSNIQLLIDLALDKIKNNKLEYGIKEDDLQLTNNFINDLYWTSKEHLNYLNDNVIHSGYIKSLGIFLYENKIMINNEFIIKMLYISRKGHMNSYYIKDLPKIIHKIISMINDVQNSPDLKDVLLILLQSKINNDVIFWSLIFSDLDINEITKSIETACTPPDILKHHLYIASKRIDENLAKCSNNSFHSI
ncbi:hypothetical protein AB6H97_002672 [Providencia rettgeri]